MNMNMENEFHMAKGEGDSSYVNNSWLQQKAMLVTKPVVDKAVREAYKQARTHTTMVVVDLGCSAGENTLLFISNVIDAVGGEPGSGGMPVELQFYLNDLPSNDFNSVFRSLQRLERSSSSAYRKGRRPPFYMAGLPRSYYARLLPPRSVHFFHSSYCLHWRSRLPHGLNKNGKGRNLNEGDIYISKTTSPSVVKLFHEQFEEDMALFLERRHHELVPGGHMVLTFHGRKTEDAYTGGTIYRLLALALQSLVQQGLVEKEKLDAFNVPIYMPSMDEVRAVVKQNGQFHVNHLELFESNWDPSDDNEEDDGHGVRDNVMSGINAVRIIRAVMEPLLSSHFGDSIMDELFEIFTCNVAKHLEKRMARYSLIVISLEKL